MQWKEACLHPVFTMNDPALNQAIGYAQWYMLRGESVQEVEDRLRTSRDHQWLTPEERQVVIAEAEQSKQLTNAIWAAYPHLRAELTDIKHRKKKRHARDKSTGPNR
jgi:hypothetical protein